MLPEVKANYGNVVRLRNFDHAAHRQPRLHAGKRMPRHRIQVMRDHDAVVSSRPRKKR